MEEEESKKRQKEEEDVWIHLKDPKLRSRLLYSNPVCLLTTYEENKLNVMVISWLSCIDNHAGIMLSINKRRFSSKALLNTGKFTLSVPTVGMEDILVRVGSCTGEHCDKFTIIEELTSCEVPWQEEYPNRILHDGIVAVMVCTVLKSEDSVNDKDHVIIFAKMLYGMVKSSYWDGKCFVGTPSILSFLGTKRFLTCSEIQ